jgi:hypothetical protein
MKSRQILATGRPTQPSRKNPTDAGNSPLTPTDSTVLWKKKRKAPNSLAKMFLSAWLRPTQRI